MTETNKTPITDFNSFIQEVGAVRAKALASSEVTLMAKKVHLLVTLEYSDPVDPHDVKNWVNNVLEHCRQESMLSDPHSETSCDEVFATIFNAPLDSAE